MKFQLLRGAGIHMSYYRMFEPYEADAVRYIWGGDYRLHDRMSFNRVGLKGLLYKRINH
jgi:hypothetical protein